MPASARPLLYSNVTAHIQSRIRDSLGEHLMDNKTLVHNMIDNVFNKHDVTHLGTYYADKCQYHDAMMNTTGLADLRNNLKSYFNSFTSMKVVIHDQIVEGDRVCTRMTCSAKDTGGYLGRPATNKKFEMNAMQVDRVQSGHIVETWFYGDHLSMMQQLGMVPKFDAAKMTQPHQPSAK
jgi:steroid delta-isomerase-like uncharacterized protein